MEDYPNDCGLQSQQKYFGDNLCGSLPRRTNVTHTHKKYTTYDARGLTLVLCHVNNVIALRTIRLTVPVSRNVAKSGTAQQRNLLICSKSYLGMYMWRYPVGMRMGRFRIDEGKTCGCLDVRRVRIAATVRLVRQRRQQRQRRNRSMVIHMRINGMDDALTWVMTGSTHCAENTWVTRHSSANPLAIHLLIHSTAKINQPTKNSTK